MYPFSSARHPVRNCTLCSQLFTGNGEDERVTSFLPLFNMAISLVISLARVCDFIAEVYKARIKVVIASEL